MEDTVTTASGSNRSTLQVLAWPVYLAAWTLFHLVDYQMRDPDNLLVGGMNDTVFGILSLASLAGFVVMVIMGTQVIRNAALRALAVMAHTAVCLVMTFFLMFYYGVGILGDTI